MTMPLKSQRGAVRTGHRKASRSPKKQTSRRTKEEGMRGMPTGAARGASFVTHFFDSNGIVGVDKVAATLGLSKGQLAEAVGLTPETLHRAKRSAAQRTQSRVREMLEIIGRVTEWAGGMNQALAWYRAEPIAAFGGRTAESLVKDGKATAVRDYLDHVALGGFA